MTTDNEWEEPPVPDNADDDPAPFGNFGVDVNSLASKLVEQAVQKAVEKQVAEVSKEAVEAVFTEEVLDEFRKRAQTAASEAMERQLEASTEEPEPEPEPAIEDETPEPEPELHYPSVVEWFDQWMRHAYKRVITGRQAPFWDPEWWRYDEALMRLDAIWRAWEHLRLDPATGMSVWWRDHADHHMAQLMSESGPFGASKVKVERGAPLPHTAPPAGVGVFDVPDSTE